MYYKSFVLNKSKYLVSIAGPTAVGKTAAAIELAKYYNTEIVSADSRQFYQEMSIGTAKPSAEELAAVPHHFIGSHSIKQNFNVGDFERDGLAKLNELFSYHDVVLMAGGSGLYVKAITDGFDNLPDIDPSVRQSLNETFAQEGIDVLQNRLQQVDPEYFETVDKNNPQRIIRALEVFESTGKPFSSFHKGASKQRKFNIIKIILDLPREELYERINKRVDLMMQTGLLEEVKQLLPYRSLNALNTVGYSEVFDYTDGTTDLNTAFELIKQNTRRFAKRQLTWFRKDKDNKWFHPSDTEGMKTYIDNFIAANG
ncbi:tRNA (adenosine(37)-N6)-dimethylallyltransferase MiaA [Mucilaginibacter sp. HME9299]|uniref:tRNA dimethylallyltransferase n=1 Tax=Mucilaginibacter aquatilis TaxID=1517760 RepID=A0A6I4I4C3_9SPHI|nr:tRNA (adenosine(37)-N6)-dimethylallyltransferase MiaA [Mucilaginibacter aquatilis]